MTCFLVLRPASARGPRRGTPRSRASLGAPWPNGQNPAGRRRKKQAPPSPPIPAFHKNFATADFDISIDHRPRKRPNPLASLPAEFHQTRTTNSTLFVAAGADSPSSAGLHLYVESLPATQLVNSFC